MWNRLDTPTRQEQWNLGLTPREELKLRSDFSTSLRAMLEGKAAPKTLLAEVAGEARQRARLPDAPHGTITIPTGARLWKPQRADVQQRDALVSGTGGYLVATDNVSFVELLRNRMVAFAMGATRLTGLEGNVTIPKQTVGATAYWLASETTAITEGNQTFAQLALTPRTVAAYTQISRLLQLQSSPDAESLILADLSKQVAIAADAACLAGTGNEQPTGILNTSGIGTFTGTDLDYTKLLNAQVDLATANALTPNCGYVTTSTVASLLQTRATFSGSQATCWQGNVLDGTVGGLRAMSSQQCPTDTMICGNWADLIVGEWGVLELAINRNDDFAKGITGVRAMYTMDCAVRYAGAFSVATSIT